MSARKRPGLIKWRWNALGSLRKAVFDGDTENGSLMAGQAAGLLHEVRPVEEIFAAMVSEAKDCIAGVYKEITL